MTFCCNLIEYIYLNCPYSDVNFLYIYTVSVKTFYVTEEDL